MVLLHQCACVYKGTKHGYTHMSKCLMALREYMRMTNSIYIKMLTLSW